MTSGNGSTPFFVIEDLHVNVVGKEILKGVNLVIPQGQVHALMGPNGSGKSTLANTLMGHPRYAVTAGRVLFKGEDLVPLAPDERARRGVFLAFQYPLEIPGVKVGNFLRLSLKARRGQDVPIREFLNTMREKMALLEMDRAFADRYVNEGFSGGEKKRAEVLQLAMLKPELAVLDETD
ncbi:MAG: Fe-S cluster assembly ATPase SufC, partial [Chloroflexi bacterium]|nr:Fe-S cluster assembly ATPase SufC [Chloroflexota bacterium]